MTCLTDLQDQMAAARRLAVDAQNDQALEEAQTEMRRIRALIEAHPAEVERRERVRMLEMDRFMNMWE